MGHDLWPIAGGRAPLYQLDEHAPLPPVPVLVEIAALTVECVVDDDMRTATLTVHDGGTGELVVRWDERGAAHGRSRGGRVLQLHLPRDAGRSHVLRLNGLLRAHRITVTDAAGHVVHDATYVNPRPLGRPPHPHTSGV